jgi:hypothetical protein
VIALLQCTKCHTTTTVDASKIQPEGEHSLWLYVFAWLRGEACRCVQPIAPSPRPVLRAV